MPEVRQLTDVGIEKFSNYLHSARATPSMDPPFGLLDDEACSEGFSGDLEVERIEFESKRDAGRYLHTVLRDGDLAEIRRNRGLWSWLALFYFDEICPVDDEGQRKVKRSEHYILVRDWRRYYRHLLVTPWELYRQYPEGAHSILSGAVNVHGDFVEQLASRQEIISNRSLVSTVDELYYDDEGDGTKRGATSRERPGNIRRLVEVKQQLDLTFDLYGMDPEQILRVLPDEFDEWYEDGN